MLVPVGVKYEALQQTGRRAGDRKEIKVDMKEKDRQTQRHSAKASKQKQQVLEFYLLKERTMRVGRGHESHLMQIKPWGRPIPVLAVVRNSFVGVGWQTQEKLAAQDHRSPLKEVRNFRLRAEITAQKKTQLFLSYKLSPVSVQGMGRGLGRTWVLLEAVVACSFHVVLRFCIRVALWCQPSLEKQQNAE